MSILVTSSLTKILQPTIIALGNFDGIHQGHQQVIKAMISRRDFFSKSYCTLVTFTPHPQEFFTGQKKQLLTPINEKSAILAKIEVKQLVLLPFDRELASLSPSQFVEDILIKQLQVKFISVGEDFCFGKNRQGNAQTLVTLAHKSQIEVIITPEQTINIEGENTRISSSYIRQALAEGNLEGAKMMLGRNYQIQGQVVEGQKLGRKIGFPTANLAIPSEKFLPRKGVYFVKIEAPTVSWGVMNIGDRPTVSGKKTTIEVHLLDWEGNLYNQELTVSLLQFLRPEQKFNSLDELKNQINLDCQIARKLIENGKFS